MTRSELVNQGEVLKHEFIEAYELSATLLCLACYSNVEHTIG